MYILKIKHKKRWIVNRHDFTMHPMQHLSHHLRKQKAAAVAQWVRAFAPQTEDWVFESKPRQTLSRLNRQ